LQNQNTAPAAQHNSDSDSDSVLRGAAQMGRALNLPRRSVEHLLQTGRLQSPRKLGGRGRWFVLKSKLLKEFVG
jgi:hypothetical protein